MRVGREELEGEGREIASLVRKTVGFVGETLVSLPSLVKEKLKEKGSGLKKCKIFIYIYYFTFLY